MIYRFLRPLLFSLPPERAHRMVMAVLSALERAAVGAPSLPVPFTAAALRQRIWGLEFPNPIGLAAGFDKNARGAHTWSAFGFGFAELGTITAEAQPGNPPPRLFRLPADEALINRLGFNNEGALAIAARLLRKGWRRPSIPIGINLGKSRVTPLDDAAADYVRSLTALFPVADYVVVNVSSPNTPGLRDLQEEGRLRQLLDRLAVANAALGERYGCSPRPLLVKLSPDLADDAIAASVRVAVESGAAGLVATNTTIARDGLRTPISEAGGLSGRPLRQRSTRVIRLARDAAGAGLPIIGVGGVFDADDAWEKISAGASLVQIYTGLIYEGPFLARRIARGLLRRLAAEMLQNVAEIAENHT